MNPLDQYVQTTLRDPYITVQQRVSDCVEMIEETVRAEFALSPDVPLTIPPEWQHKVPVEHRIAGHISTAKSALPIEPLRLQLADLVRSSVTEPAQVKRWWQR